MASSIKICVVVLQLEEVGVKNVNHVQDLEHPLLLNYAPKDKALLKERISTNVPNFQECAKMGDVKIQSVVTVAGAIRVMIMTTTELNVLVIKMINKYR